MITNRAGYTIETTRMPRIPDKLKALRHLLWGHPVCYNMRIAGSPDFLNGDFISGKFGDFPSYVRVQVAGNDRYIRLWE